MGVAIVCIFSGAFILSIILSQFTSGMSSLGKTRREYTYQVLLLVVCKYYFLNEFKSSNWMLNRKIFFIKKYLRNSGLSENHQQLVKTHFQTVIKYLSGLKPIII